MKESSGTETWLANLEEWDPDVFSTLYNLGFFEILDLEEISEDMHLEGEKAILRMRSGRTTDSSEIASLTAALLQLFPGSEDEHGVLLRLYGALLEAVDNTHRHAYPSDQHFRFGHVNKWWVTGAVDRSKGWMTAVAFDQGLTIPLSLPEWTHHAGWSRKLKNLIGIVPRPEDTRYDGEVIEVAVQESVTAISEAKHGTGLAQMREFIDQCSDGHLRILSRCGEVIFRPNRQPTVKTHRASIGGTLIEWNVSI